MQAALRAADAFGSIAVDPIDPEVVFAISYGSTVKRSNDGGAHWSEFDRTGVPQGAELSAVVVDSATSKILHLAVDSGVFSYTQP